MELPVRLAAADPLREGRGGLNYRASDSNDDGFGSAIAVDGNTLLIGDAKADSGSGVAYQIQVQIPKAMMNSTEELRNLAVPDGKGQSVLLLFRQWIAFITVLFVLPPNELTGYIFAGTLVVMLAFYFLRVRGKFRGPMPQTKSREQLLKLEAELEQ